jgi:signal transduction histidine kinase
MQKFNRKALLLLLIVLFYAPREVYSAPRIKNVVIFFSWNATLPAYQKVLEGFYSTFSEEIGITCNLSIEYLDKQKPQNEIYVKSIVALYNDKYKDIPIDLLIIVGPMGYKVLKYYGLNALKSTPTICIDNDDLINDTSQYPLHNNIVQIELKYDFFKTLKTGFGLFPGYKDVYVISGTTLLDKYYISKWKTAAKSFEDTYSIHYVSDLSMDSLLLLVENIPRKSLVYVPSFYLDKQGVPYSTSEVIAIIARHCKAPVMPVADVFTTRKGGLGGYVFSFTNVGKEMGRVAGLILEGTSVQHVKIRYKTFYEDVYDWQELNRWGLANSKFIPDDSVFYYKPTSFLEEYRWYILIVFVFLISQTFFILYLVKLNKRQKETALQRLETEKIYHDLVREDRLSKMVELTASLSHELNQPLTAILYNAQAGKRFLKTGKMDLKQAEEIFDFIIEDDKRAGGIISSVKNLMKPENREMENVNLTSLIQETVDIFYSEAITRSVTIKVELPENPVWIYGEKIQLQQVLLNLFRNAINAMENNALQNKLLDIGMKVNKASVIVSVRDSGCGIDPAIKDKLFKAFVSGSKKGFGIGLALSRTIIENHHGEIWAGNLPGSGAEFSFRLKVIREE